MKPAGIVRELDVARMGESGGSVVVDLRVPLPDGEVSGIYVETHDPGEGGLDRLCEAAAISGGNGGA